jgi:hypothetical protein
MENWPSNFIWNRSWIWCLMNMVLMMFCFLFAWNYLKF